MFTSVLEYVNGEYYVFENVIYYYLAYVIVITFLLLRVSQNIFNMPLRARGAQSAMTH